MSSEDSPRKNTEEEEEEEEMGLSDDDFTSDESSDEDEGDYLPIIIDNGAYSIKIGFSHSDLPTEEIPAVVARQRGGSSYVGSALQSSGILDTPGQTLPDYVAWPAWREAISNWTDVEAIWEEGFKDMDLDLENNEHSCLATVPCQSATSLPKQMYEILFEKFNMAAAHVTTGPLVAPYAYGETTGLVIDIGHTSAQVVPVVEGYEIAHATRKGRHLGGVKATELLLRSLDATGTELGCNPWHTKLLVQRIQQQLGWVASSKADYEIKLKGNYGKSFRYQKTRGGPMSRISLHEELLAVGEYCFNPQGIEGDAEDSIASIQRMVAECVMKCTQDVRGMLLQNILLSGGVTTLPGFAQRLESELKILMPHAKEMIRVRADYHRSNTIWTGGAVLSNLDSFQDRWLGNWEYKEYGPRILDNL